MAKVAVVYAAKTRHVLGCFTAVAGDTGAAPKIADVVGAYMPVRDPAGGGQTVFVPSGNDALKVALIDVPSRPLLAQLFAAPFGFSVDAAATALTPNDPEQPAPSSSPPAHGLEFEIEANPPGKALACVIAVQQSPPASDSPAVLISDAMDPTSNSKTMSIDVGASHYVLFVEDRTPLVK